MKDLLRVVTESRINYGLGYLVDLACPLVLGYVGWRQRPAWIVALAGVSAGVAVFSFVEYAIHRWLFHAPGSVMGAMHQAHHDEPAGHSALPCITSAAVAATAWLLLVPLVGSPVACFFLCGVLGGYFHYGALHHLEHRVRINALPFRWLQRRWAVHSVHHRLLDANFGVTTSFWDRVFGTHYQSASRHHRQS
jgi:4-hydroxysphinganine ceramide fatty acyl 2-hydroxylase